MKKIILIIAIIAVGGLFFMNSNKKDDGNKAPNEGVSKALSFELADSKYEIDQTQSKISWSAKKKILTNWVDRGEIKASKGVFEIRDGEVVSNELVLDMNSIIALSTGKGTDQDKLTGHLKSDSFFDVANHPTASFVATEVILDSTKTGGKDFFVKGDLTIKGITNKITVPVNIDFTNDETIKATGSVDLDRTLWDIRYGSDKFFENLGDKAIDDIFTVSFDITISKVK